MELATAAGDGMRILEDGSGVTKSTLRGSVGLKSTNEMKGHTVAKPILLYWFWGVSQMLSQKNRKKLKFVHVFMQI
jgi:hypothetical protein